MIGCDIWVPGVKTFLTNINMMGFSLKPSVFDLLFESFIGNPKKTVGVLICIYHYYILM